MGRGSLPSLATKPLLVHPRGIWGEWGGTLLRYHHHPPPLQGFRNHTVSPRRHGGAGAPASYHFQALLLVNCQILGRGFTELSIAYNQEEGDLEGILLVNGPTPLRFQSQHLGVESSRTGGAHGGAPSHRADSEHSVP